MRIIDAHMHFSNVAAFRYAAEDAGVHYSGAGWLAEARAAGVAAAVCMGLQETAPGAFPDEAAPAAMDADLEYPMPQNIKVCLGVNPQELRKYGIAGFEQALRQHGERIAGFKIYAGYYHLMVHDPVYTPIYRLAAEHGLNVAIHTGDTFSERGLLEFSHPLAADRLAVTHRDVNFILCHMGDPWIMDATEVAYKNHNVYMDISGLLAGNAAHIEATERRELAMEHYKRGLVYLNNYKKILFGTDWPLVPIGRYIDFCKKLVPLQAWGDVFYDNAAELFGFN